jgi:hyperosmotically inducible protein
MNVLKANLTFCVAIAMGALAACSTTKAPDVSSNVRSALDQAGLKDVSESQDRDKAVITLSGHVSSEADKAQAELIAKSVAGGQVVANQIEVLPPGNDSDIKAIDSDLDKGIEKNLDAALIQDGLQHDVDCKVKNGVVTLTGSVDSQTRRGQAERIAAGVPNVRQVVNELQVKNQRATTSQ